jgi:hypothetical protein
MTLSGQTRICSTNRSRRQLHKLPIQAARLFDPATHIGVGVQLADLLPAEPRRCSVLITTDNDWLGLCGHDTDPVRPLTEADRVAHDAVVLTGAQPGLLIGLTHRGAQRGFTVRFLGVALGETPDTGVATLEQKIVLLTLRARPCKNDAGANIGKLVTLRDNRHLV